MTDIKQEQIQNAEAGPSTPTFWPTAPVYSFNEKPQVLARVSSSSLMSEVKNNFFRSARWSPDGSAILTTSEDRSIRIYKTPTEDTLNQSLSDPAECIQPDAIHAASWFPSASALTPETFCFVASVRDTPVRLIDGTDGRIRATYPIIDHRERFISPHCLTFNSTATKIYAGFENAIEVLEVGEPGYGNSERLKTSQTRKGKTGQKGIISALAFSTDYSGTFAAGTYNGSVALYSEDTGPNPILHLDGIDGGGVTQLAFHPLNPSKLFIASRKSTHIQVYDINNPTAPIAHLPRKGETNQRLWFDIDPWGRWLASGDTDGVLRIWDILENVDEQINLPKLIYEKKIHNDTIGSVCFHPYRPLILTVSGSRCHSPLENEENDSDSESETSDESENTENDSELPIVDHDGNLGGESGPGANDTGDGLKETFVEDDSLRVETDKAPSRSGEGMVDEEEDGKRDHTMTIWRFAPP